MESTKQLVNAWMATETDSLVVKTVLGISNDRITLLAVVKALGEYLTSGEGEVRAKAVTFLSSVLARCDKLNHQSTEVLVLFYCEKLNDKDSIVPALNGLLSMTRLPSCTPVDAMAILRAMFSYINMKVLEQSTRFLAFSIIDSLMARRREALKSMGDEFLSGYILLAEYEKDPRNLLLLFAITRVVLIEFNISNHIEDLFNTTFCYFPITFIPPPNDPNGVTADHLKTALGTCLNATPAFGQAAIPFLLEKLVAGSPPLKRDTLDAMASCFPVYGAALVRGSAVKLWSALKIEIFYSTDPRTEAAAINVLKVLVKTILASYNRPEDSREQIGFLVDVACEDCVHVLREPEKSQAKLAIKVVCAFSSAAASVFCYAIAQVVPCLIHMFRDPDQLANRPSILVHLSDLVAAARDSLPAGSHSSHNISPLILPFKAQIFGAEIESLKCLTCRLGALGGIKEMVTTKALLTDYELCVIVNNANGLLEVGSDQDDTRNAVLDILSIISNSAPWLIREQTIPFLLSSLPDQSLPRTATVERTKCYRNLSALGALCVQPDLFEVLVIRLMAKLNLLCSPVLSTAMGPSTETKAAYAHAILTTLYKTLTMKMDGHHTDKSKYGDRLIPALYGLLLSSALASGNYPVGTDRRIIQAAAQIVTLIVQVQALPKQQVFAVALFSAFLAGNVNSLVEGYYKPTLDVKFHPFARSAPSLQKNMVVLFAAGAVALRQELRVPVPNLSDFLNMLMVWSIAQAENDIQKDAAWQIVAAIVNKHADDVTGFLSRELELHQAQLAMEARSPENVIRSRAQIVKALLFRDHIFLIPFANQLFELFGHEDVYRTAAKVVGEVGYPDETLTRSHHASIKILYAQKYVTTFLPQLISVMDAANGIRQQISCLVALTSLVKSVPKATYVHLASTLIPFFIHGLDLPDFEVQANAITALSNLSEGCKNNSSVVVEYASTLVSKMLKNSMHRKMPSIKVRVAALRYLATMPVIKYYDTLRPFKIIVIRELTQALDDPRQVVRKEAVRTRTIWFNFDK